MCYQCMCCGVLCMYVSVCLYVCMCCCVLCMYVSVCLVYVCVCVYVCMYVCVHVSLAVFCRFDKEMSDVMQEMKKGGVLEFRRQPVPPLSALKAIDSRQWQGLNTSYLHARYPR